MPNLVGTGLNQVPTNGMLGGMAYQSPDHASIKSLDLKNLSQINSEIADTAVDVFVYDTSKDSDGGAWRKRTQSTSWYNETLNTSTRGTRREFPAVAVIVAESDKVTIYDGDDPDMPMWMVFNRASNNMLFNGSSSGRKVEALNGHVALANSDALFACSFIDDRGYLLNASNTYESGNILARNSGYGYNITSTVNKLVSSVTNDVAMTVLPNAPVDPSTGLPIPTIAVATNGGLSIIRDDGTVVDATPTSSGWYPTTVSTYERNKFIMGTSNTAGGYILPVFNSDTTYNIVSTPPSNGWLHFRSNGANADIYLDLNGASAGSGLPITAVSSMSVGSAKGMNIFDVNDNSHSNSLVAYVTSHYSTGWQHGDIKGAFLSDTDTASNPELVTNGTFGSNVNDWNTTSVTIVRDTTIFSGGGIKVTTPGGASFAYQQVTGLVSGKQYIFTARAYNPSGNSGTDVATISIVSAGYTASTASSTTVDNTIQDLSVIFTASGTTETIYLSVVAAAYNVYGQNGSIGYFDNVSVRLAEEDRSVNNNSLAVYGTITKTPVATGAELVGYSGFSSSNYLERNTNAVNFGTSGKISFTGWVKQSSTSEYSYITSVTGSSTGNPVGIALMTSTGNFYVYEGTTVRQSSTSISDGNWHHCVGIIDGTTVRGYVDGREVLNTTGTAPNLSSIDEFAVGHFATSGRAYPNLGSLALVRISASFPTAEQVKKMYEDEKVLFQENAKCTLYGSSDAVTALAYDDTTSLLHVGTSGGRSTFSGLKRVENTTTAVATAISASNGLVAEQ